MLSRNRLKLSFLICISFLVGLCFILGPGMVKAAEEVRIGVVIPLSGPPAKFGAIQRNALTMAAEDVNNAGGIKSLGGARITLVFGDTRGEPDIGVTETERLITQEKVHAVLGAFQSGVGFPSSAVAERYQTPWVNFWHFRQNYGTGIQIRLPGPCQ